MSGSDDRLECFAVCSPGLEPVIAAELVELGIRGEAEAGGVAWESTPERLYAANLELRTATRVLVRVAEFRARTFFELERHARRIRWARFLAPGRAVELRVTCRKSRLYHEGAVAERVRDAIQERLGPLPAPPTDGSAASARDDHEGADAQLFVVRFLRDRCTLSVDASGAPLYRRGYRRAVGRAPLRETLAAAMLRASGWTGQAPLLDPMCGSGTIPIEAALLARRIAPGLAGGGRARAFAFEHWPEFDRPTLDRLLARAQQRILPRSGVAIHASDRDAGAIAAAHANASRAGVLADLALVQAPISAVEPPRGSGGRGWIVTNPPYGTRVGQTGPLRNLYAAVGALARSRLQGWRLALLSAEPVLEAQLGLDFTEALRTQNGGIPVRLLVGEVEPG